MQRRNFLSGILGLAATAAAAPLINLLPAAPAPTYTSFLVGQDAIVNREIEQYADYVDASDLLLETSIDPDVELAGKEISYRFHYTYNNCLNQL